MWTELGRIYYISYCMDIQALLSQTNDSAISPGSHPVLAPFHDALPLKTVLARRCSRRAHSEAAASLPQVPATAPQLRGA